MHAHAHASRTVGTCTYVNVRMRDVVFESIMIDIYSYSFCYFVDYRSSNCKYRVRKHLNFYIAIVLTYARARVHINTYTNTRIRT